MRREVIICDICGKVINKGDARIKAKIRVFDSWDNDMLWESQKWKKLDICTHCLNEMSIYIKTKGGANRQLLRDLQELYGCDIPSSRKTRKKPSNYGTEGQVGNEH